MNTEKCNRATALLRAAWVGLAAGLVLGCGTPQPLADTTPKPAPLAAAPVSAPAVEAAAPALAAAAPPALPAEDNNIFFASRSARIDDAGKEKLREHARRLALDRKVKLTLVVHNDGQGSRSYNLAISEERLVAVEKALRSYGVSSRQIRRNRSIGLKSLSPCTNDECRQQMRRVELLYLP